jgi:hypothetical protein
MQAFYSYLWLRASDGSPYYVGKGTGRRAFHVAHGVHRPKDRNNILIFPQDSEADAFESERALIWLFGRKDNGTGILRNLTDGGEGQTGRRHRHTAATKAKMSLSHKKRWADPRYKGLRGPSPFLGRHHTEQANMKNRVAHLGKARSQETKDKQAKSMTGFHHSEVTKRRIAASRRTPFLKTIAWG